MLRFLIDLLVGVNLLEIHNRFLELDLSQFQKTFFLQMNIFSEYIFSLLFYLKMVLFNIAFSFSFTTAGWRIRDRGFFSCHYLLVVKRGIVQQERKRGGGGVGGEGFVADLPVL